MKIRLISSVQDSLPPVSFWPACRCCQKDVATNSSSCRCRVFCQTDVWVQVNSYSEHFYACSAPILTAKIKWELGVHRSGYVPTFYSSCRDGKFLASKFYQL